MSRYTPYTWADDPSGGTPITAARLQAIEDGIDLDVPVADIDATGTPSGSTYLRGDGTWSTPAGGGASDLDDLTDVDVSTVPPTDGQSLVFDTADNLWKPATVSGGGGGAVDSVNGATGTVVLDQDDVGDGTTYKQYSATEKTKLAGIASGATANDTDANLKDRANHTGTQAASTIGSGTMATARLGSGTASSGTYLRGDQTYAALPTSSDTVQGIVELATTGEATTGTDTARAVTAAGVKAVMDAHVALSDPHTQYLKETDNLNKRDAVFSQGGTLTTGAGQFRLYNRSGSTRTLHTVTASVGTQPTGSSILVDVNKNGTTIFTTQSNRPTIAVSTNEDESGAPDVTSWASGDYLTVDIDQIGSTIAGADLTVTVVYS